MKTGTIGVDTMWKCNNCGGQEFKQRDTYKTIGWEIKECELDKEGNQIDSDFIDGETEDTEYTDTEWTRCKGCGSEDIDMEYETEVTPTLPKINEQGDYWS